MPKTINNVCGKMAGEGIRVAGIQNICVYICRVEYLITGHPLRDGYTESYILFESNGRVRRCEDSYAHWHFIRKTMLRT